MSSAVGPGQVQSKKPFLTEKGKALWVLAIFSPVFAELMSGSSPPFEFFNPLNFAFLLGLYGTGVLLMRELAVRWDKGWPSLILLGAAYGILEEGVAVKSFFDPGWMDLGDLGVYGRVLDTNWVWAFWLTIFHAVISISLPIIVFNLLYPQYKREPLLTGRRFWIVAVLLLIDVIFIANVLNPYYPSPGMYLLCIAVMFIMILAAKALPKDFLSVPPKPEGPAAYWSTRRLFLLGLFLMLGPAISVGAIKEPIPYQFSIMVLLMISAFVYMELATKMPPVNNRVHMAYFAAGLFGFLALFGILLGLGGAIDMAVVAVVVILFAHDLTRLARGLPVIVFRFGPFVSKN